MFKKMFFILAVSLILNGCDDEPKSCPVYGAPANAHGSNMSVVATFDVVATDLVLDGVFHETVGGGGSGTIDTFYSDNLDVMHIKANAVEEQYFEIEIFYDRISYNVEKVSLHVEEGELSASTWFSCLEAACTGITFDQGTQTLQFDHVPLTEEGGATQETITGNFKQVVHEAPDEMIYPGEGCY